MALRPSRSARRVPTNSPASMALTRVREPRIRRNLAGPWAVGSVQAGNPPQLVLTPPPQPIAAAAQPTPQPQVALPVAAPAPQDVPVADASLRRPDLGGFPWGPLLAALVVSIVCARLWYFA